jgi:effector-binding domain-containing protein
MVWSVLVGGVFAPLGPACVLPSREQQGRRCTCISPWGRRVTRLTVPAVELAVITHHGSHDDVDRAYGALGSYVAEHALGVDGPLREFYVVGAHDTADQTLWHTEIGWPIFHTGADPSTS